VTAPVALLLGQQSGFSSYPLCSQTDANSANVILWNVEGLINLLAKLPDNLFLNANFLFFFETFLLAPIDIPNFYGIHTLATSSETQRGRPSGGISIFVSPTFGPVTNSESSIDHDYLIVRCKNVTLLGFYLKPTMSVNDHTNTIEEALRKVQNDKNVIITGDFNARADFPNEKFTNLISSTNLSGYSLFSDKATKTYVCYNGSSVIDFLFCNKNDFTCTKYDVVTYTSEAPMRKHFPIAAKIKFNNTDRTPNSNCAPTSAYSPKINFMVALEHVDEFNQRYNNFIATKDIDGLLKLVKDFINKVAIAKKVSTRTAKPWFDKYCHIAKFSILLVLHQLRSINFNNPALLLKYNTERKRYKVLIESKKLEFNLKSENKAVEEAEQTPYKFLHKDLAVPVRSCINMGTWETHFGNLLNKINLTSDNTLNLKTICDNYVSPCAYNPITNSEISEMLSKCKNKKASGPDFIRNEHLKLTAGLTIDWLTSLLNMCTEYSYVPPEWRISHLKVLYKGKGERDSPDSYRGLALGSNVCKLGSKIYANQLYEYVKQFIPEEQFGFVKGKSTIDAVFKLLSYITVELEKDRGFALVAFVDLRKAFDSVIRRILLEIVRDFNTVPIELLRMLCAILDVNYIQVHDGLLLSDPIIQSNGVLQGDPLSSLLFNLLTHDLPSKIANATNGDAKVVMYADDLAIVTNNVTALQTALDALFVWCQEKGMQVNESKTKIVKFRNGGRPTNENVMYNNVKLELVNEMEYLGFTLQCTTRSFTKHISKRCTNAITAMHAISNISLLSIDTAIKLFHLKIAPIASYGIQVTWSKLKISDLDKLEAVKASFLKRAMKLSKYTKTRLAYLLANCDFFVTELKTQFGLPNTAAYESFLNSRTDKFGDIDPEFTSTRAMTSDQWKLPQQSDRHVDTRFAVHGFHHLVCVNPAYHNATSSCVCKLCGKKCETYHLIKCTKRTKTLYKYANED
jgi:hypothetical protein